MMSKSENLLRSFNRRRFLKTAGASAMLPAIPTAASVCSDVNPSNFADAIAAPKTPQVGVG